MQGNAGKVAGLAVAVGIGGAVLLGLGCGIASADGASDTSSARQTSAAPAHSARADRSARAERAVRTEARPRARVERVRVGAPTTVAQRRAARRGDEPAAPELAAPLMPLALVSRRDRGHDITEGPQTVVTGPPSLRDRLILRTLQKLRHEDSDIFDGDGGNVTYTSPPAWVTRRVTVSESVYQGTKVVTLAPKKPTGEYVLALHGGGLVAEANIINWADYAAMARDTGATVVVPIYPLAPPKGNATVETLVPPMADYLSAMVAEHGAENVALYGDSAGGTYAMLVAQELVRRCRAVSECVAEQTNPSRMVLISPVLHLTLSGPIVDDIDDPIIPARPPLTGTGDLNPDDPHINPIMVADLTGLPPTAIYVGTVERPYPGDLLFRDKLLAQDPGANFTVIVGDGQMHDWALGGIFVNSQARQWRPTIYRQLGLLS